MGIIKKIILSIKAIILKIILQIINQFITMLFNKRITPFPNNNNYYCNFNKLLINKENALPLIQINKIIEKQVVRKIKKTLNNQKNKQNQIKIIQKTNNFLAL